MKPNQKPPVHHVTPGDVLYYTHEKDGPTTGEVLAHGQHGCTLEHPKGHVQVPWDRIHGHKSRVPLEMRVEDQGEDGAIVKGKDGKRHYVHGLGEESPDADTTGDTNEREGQEELTVKKRPMLFKVGGKPTPKNKAPNQSKDTQGPSV